MKCLEIKINDDKSVHVNNTLHKTENIQIILNQTLISQKFSELPWNASCLPFNLQTSR